MRKSIPEIFKEVNQASGTEAKLKVLQDNYNVSVAAVLSILFNPNIKINLPKGIPDGFEFGTTPSISLERAIRSFPSFTTTADSTRLQIGWTRLMKNLSEEEARFAFAIKDREVATGLTQADVASAFPTLIPAPVETKPVQETKAQVESTETTGVDGSKVDAPEPEVVEEFPEYGAETPPEEPAQKKVKTPKKAPAKKG